jgi:hypothetical protein
VREHFARLLYDRRDLPELRALYRRDEASEHLILLLAELGEVRELRRRTRRFEPRAGRALAAVLLARGDAYGAYQALGHAACGENTNEEETAMLRSAWSLQSGFRIPAFVAWVILYVFPGTAIFAWGCGFPVGTAFALGLLLGGPASLAVLFCRAWALPSPLVTWLARWIFRPLFTLLARPFPPLRSQRRGTTPSEPDDE